MTITVDTVADGVHAVIGRLVNWLVLIDGTDVTLIDTGYPGDHVDVEASIHSLGRKVEDVRAVLITHAHIDHVGNADHITQVSNATAYAHPAELAQLRGEVKHQVSPGALAKQLLRPGVSPWLARAVRNGGAKQPTAVAQAFDVSGAPLDVPGHPVPIATPGHTPGSCCFYLPQHGIIASGDSLITAHPTTSRQGPQLITPMFQNDEDEARRSLSALASLDGDVLVPGHGPVHHGSIAKAAEVATTT